MEGNQYPKALDTPQFLEAYFHTNKSRLLIFDYDGTLTPIVNDPAAAVLSPQVLSDLATLAKDVRTEVWIVSGRNQAWLEVQVGSIPQLGLCAEHGAFTRRPGAKHWQDHSTGEDMTWQPHVAALFEGLTGQFAGSHVEAKKAAVVWHYRRAKDFELAEKKAQSLVPTLKETVGRSWDVEIANGKCIVEVRARALGKGAVVGRLLQEKSKDFGFAACFGDDRTDEDMFRAFKISSLPSEGIFSVKVGSADNVTDAVWFVQSPADVHKYVAVLTKPEVAETLITIL